MYAILSSPATKTVIVCDSLVSFFSPHAEIEIISIAAQISADIFLIVVLMITPFPFLFISIVLICIFSDNVKNAHQYNADEGRDPADAPSLTEKPVTHWTCLMK